MSAQWNTPKKFHLRKISLFLFSKENLQAGTFFFLGTLASSLVPSNPEFTSHMPAEIIEAIEKYKIVKKKTVSYPATKCTIHVHEIKATNLGTKSFYGTSVNPFVTISEGLSPTPFWQSPSLQNANPKWTFKTNETIFLKRNLWSTYRLSFWSSKWLSTVFLGAVDLNMGIVQILQHSVTHDKVELTFTNLINFDPISKKNITDLTGVVTIKLSVLKSEDD